MYPLSWVSSVFWILLPWNLFFDLFFFFLRNPSLRYHLQCIISSSNHLQCILSNLLKQSARVKFGFPLLLYTGKAPGVYTQYDNPLFFKTTLDYKTAQFAPKSPTVCFILLRSSAMQCIYVHCMQASLTPLSLCRVKERPTLGRNWRLGIQAPNKYHATLVAHCPALRLSSSIQVAFLFGSSWMSRSAPGWYRSCPSPDRPSSPWPHFIYLGQWGFLLITWPQPTRPCMYLLARMPAIREMDSSWSEHFLTWMHWMLPGGGGGGYLQTYMYIYV